MQNNTNRSRPQEYQITMAFSMRPALRRFAIRLLKTFGDRDISIRHHWVDGKIRLNLYRHRGYWWEGRRREQEALEAVSRIVKPGDNVFELGGHIGYITMLLSKLAGPKGRVVVFEPSPDNLKYLRSNVVGLSNTEVVDKAVSSETGQVTLYEEGLSGQNNSIVSDYEIFDAVRSNSGLQIEVKPRQVACTTVDDEASQRAMAPSFMKIDIEGAELLALQGALRTLDEARPVIMIELSQNVQACLKLFQEHGYLLVAPEGTPVEFCSRLANVYAFALPKERSEALREAFPNR
ncbi:MAG: FkbM family methyltransferase [Gemmataceae bacterium]